MDSSKRNCNLKLCPEKNFKWQKGKVKALGVWLSTDQQLTISLNYNEKLAKIQTILGCWKFRRLSLIGKITVLKSLVASQLDLMHLFWKCQKTKNFWDNFSIWLQSCQILQPGSYLDMTTALGLTPDGSSFKLHINFCCLIAKNFIWICRSKECFPIHNNFLFHLRHIYQLENKTPRNTKKWKPFFSSLGLVS